MKNNLKKFLFPFFKKSKHHFLMDKWYFRMLFVFYIISIFFLFFKFAKFFCNSSWCGCYENSLLWNSSEEISEHLNSCAEMMKNDRLGVFVSSFFLTFFTHFIFQIAFFKLIVDFIILGNSNKK